MTFKYLGGHVNRFRLEMSTYSSMYSSVVKRPFSVSKQIALTLTHACFRTPTGALCVNISSIFFQGDTYFGNNSVKITGGKERLKNTCDVPRAIPLQTRCRHRKGFGRRSTAIPRYTSTWMMPCTQIIG